MSLKWILSMVAFSIGVDLASAHNRKIFFEVNSVFLEQGEEHYVNLVLDSPLKEDAIVDIWCYDQGKYTNSSNGIIEYTKSVIFKADHNEAQVEIVRIAASNVGELAMVVRSSSPELNLLPNFNGGVR